MLRLLITCSIMVTIPFFLPCFLTIAVHSINIYIYIYIDSYIHVLCKDVSLIHKVKSHLNHKSVDTALTWVNYTFTVQFHSSEPIITDVYKMILLGID